MGSRPCYCWIRTGVGAIKVKLSALHTLQALQPRAAEDLEDYAQRLRFSPELTDACAATLLRSIELGDGALWSDSLLVNGLALPDGSLRSMFDRFPGYRTSTLAGTEFKSTLATQHLIIRPEFQSDLTSILLADSKQRRRLLSVERLLEIELRCALEFYRDDHTELAEFVSKLSRRIRKFDPTNKYLKRMAYLIEDIVVLALLTNTHPFDALSRVEAIKHGSGDVTATSLGIAKYPREYFMPARRRFYFQLRDTSNVPPEMLSDSDLDTMSRAFSYDHFVSVCQSAYSNDYDRDVPESLRGKLYYAAALLWAAELPVSLLAERLAAWRPDETEALWPLSKKVLLSVGESALEVGAFDMLSPMSLDSPEFGRGSDLKRSLADVGVWTPSPIWTDSVLERLEHLLGIGADEKAFQFLFEAYPDFILDELHTDLNPQIILFQEKGPTLRPDFAVRRHRSIYIDLIELKKPTCKVVIGTNERPRLSVAAIEAIAQLKHYREWFRSAENRRWFRNTYGLEGYEPRLTLIIGRRPPTPNEEVWARALSGAEANILTYDDIRNIAMRRRRYIP